MSGNFFVILGNQLFDPKILKSLHCDHVFLAEDVGLCTYQKHHKLKIYLFLCAMREYRDELERAGIKVSYFGLEDRDDSSDYISFLRRYIKKNNISQINFFEIEDSFFENTVIKNFKENGLQITFHQSPMFMFSREEFRSIQGPSKTFRLGNFYKQARKKFNILIDSDSEPIGKKWSFDEENRKKIPNNVLIPELRRPKLSKYHNKVIHLIEENFSKHPGRIDNVWFPVQRNGVYDQLNDFLHERLTNFGVYEDAMRQGKNFLFHSCISPFLNIGLITPDEVISKVIEIFKKEGAPLNSVEGFVRQIIGWREFIRGIYQMIGKEQEERNFWNHRRSLCDEWYSGTTGLLPLDDCIKTAVEDGYNHHIPRLMVISNLMNLCEIDPKLIFKWFMEMYIDSSDWVMVPNVFGMATFADGGLMSTKPYSCSSNYILKMSNYGKGDWCDTVDGLYWRFIDKNKDFYKSNHRLSFQTKILDRLNPVRKEKIFKAANHFIERNTRES